MRTDYDYTVIELVNNAFRLLRAQPLFLGGVDGASGGSGGPPGGIVGKLPQKKSAYDTSELATNYTPASGRSLLDNLNHIRYRIEQIETGSGVASSLSIYDDGVLVASGISILDFGTSLNVTDLGGGHVLVDSTASGGGATTFLGLTDTPDSYTGQGNKIVAVSSGETGLTFVTISGGGDMLKSIYDADDNGIIDIAESVPWSGITNTPSALAIDPNLNPTNGQILQWNADSDMWEAVNYSGSATVSGLTEVHEDLTYLLDGVATNFTTLYPITSGSLSVFYNGVRQEPSVHFTEDVDKLGFTTLFTPSESGVLLADYLTTSSGTTVTSIAYYIPVSGLFTIRDEGTEVGHATVLNFVGSEVEATISGSVANITVIASAPGRTLLFESTPTGTGTVTFSGIAGTYNKIVIEFAARSTQAAAMVNGLIQFNGDATDANYRWVETESHAAGTTGGNGGSARQFTTGISAATATASSFTIGKFEIIQYANTGFFKQAKYQGSHLRDTSSIYEVNYSASTVWRNTAAITQIDIVLSAGNYDTNSIFRVYGEN